MGNMGCKNNHRKIHGAPLDLTKTHSVSKLSASGAAGERVQERTRYGQTTTGSNNSSSRNRAKIDSRVTAKYTIKALIGKGTFSRVVRVEDKVSKQPYAIKIIERRQGREVFEAELGVLRRVRHPNIVQLFEVFESSDKVYMVMELATGGELFDRIVSKGSFTESDAVNLLRMVLDALRYLHELGIVHRDLKPENLLYYHPGADSKIMVTDFGLSATVRANDPFMKTSCGTPEYVAPEIILRQPYTCAVDQWATGVITYILLSGSMPFEDENRTRLFRKIIGASYSYNGEPWQDVSSSAKNFIDLLLKLDPADRLSAENALQHSWIVTGGQLTTNLQKRITHNLLKRQNSRPSNQSGRRSQKSSRSLRSEHHRVEAHELDELAKDPEVRSIKDSFPPARMLPARP